MPTSYAPTYVGGSCKSKDCSGEYYQYTEDASGVLRCGRCGELKPVAKTTAVRKAAASTKEAT